MKVQIIKDWDQPNLFRQTPGSKGIWGDFSFTEKSVFNSDALVVLNSTPHNILSIVRKGGRLLMSQEPPHPFYSWQTDYYKFYDKIYCFWNQSDFPDSDIINLQTALPWHIGKSYDELMAMDNIGLLNKQNKICWITSNLNTRPGHNLRLSFIEYLRKEKFEFELYGRGFQEIPDKFSALSSAKYGIAIENFGCPDYWTEKIADCLLSWTMPIYFGCTNITEYFPEQAMIRIDPNEPGLALRTIRNAMEEGIWEKSLHFIAEARQMILNKYQFFPAISERLKKINLGRKKIYWIPKSTSKR